MARPRRLVRRPSSACSPPPGRGLGGERDPAAVLAAARAVIDDERAPDRLGRRCPRPGGPGRGARPGAGALTAPSGSGLTRVINATGVILHTNLGRAPWPRAAIEAAGRRRGRLLAARARPRLRPARRPLPGRGGAPDRADRRRGRAGHEQQRGGRRPGRRPGRPGRPGRSSRAASWSRSAAASGSPRSSGAAAPGWSRSGTTNRTRAADFEAALADGGARAVLRVHPSNFVIAGFTEAPDATAVAALAHRHGAIVIDDLGSGALLPTEQFGLAHEPMPAERLAAGADLVTFSGDKLVGGPQAGLIVGRADLVARLRRDPLARAMRPDKATLAGLGATLGALPRRPGPAGDPDLANDRRGAGRAAGPGGGDPGGPPGSGAGPGRRRGGRSRRSAGARCPARRSPRSGCAVGAPRADRALGELRRGEPCIVARIADDALVLDLRTVEPADDPAVGRALGRALGALVGS